MEKFYFDLPATRGVQAGRAFYLITTPFSILKRLVAFDAGNVLDRSQRAVNLPRARKISQYLKQNKTTFVLPSLTGVINEAPEFIEWEESPNIGILRIDMGAVINLVDGQHRATGIIDAVESDDTLRTEMVPLMLYVDMSLQDRQMAFTDINSHTVKPSASISDSYNQRDDLPRLIVEMANELPCFKTFVDFERNSISRKSEYLFPVKILKDATAKLLSLKVSDSLNDEQRELARQFWASCDKPLLWTSMRTWRNYTADDFREEYLSSHGVFLNALGLLGKQLLTQFGDFSAMRKLSSLNIKRHSEDFQGRCLDTVTGNMISNAVAIKLTAIKLMCAVGCPVPPEMQVMERQYFSDTQFPSTSDNSQLELVETPSEEITEETKTMASDLVDGAIEEELDPFVCAHPFAETVRHCWEQAGHTEFQVDELCDKLEALAVEFGLSTTTCPPQVSVTLTTMKKPSFHLATLRANFKKAVMAEAEA